MAEQTTSQKQERLTPTGLDRAAAWSWRLLIVGAAVVVLALLLWALRGVVIPIFVALLIATQVTPLTYRLQRRGLPRGASAAIGLLLTAVFLLLVGVVIVGSIVSEADELGASISAAVDDITVWAERNDGPLGLEAEKVEGETSKVADALENTSDWLFSGVIAGASLLVEFTGGLVLALTFLIYMLLDGAGVFRWIVERFPAGHPRETVDRLGRRGWVTLGGYVRGIGTVAFIVSTLIGIGLVLLGVPLAGALALLTFILAFIPIAGAWISGIVAGLVAFADGGIGLAAAVAVLILGVQQIDSAFITPNVYKRQVNLHPMVTLAAVAAGGIVAGIIGAFLAVPIVATIWTMVSEFQKMRAGEQAAQELREATRELGAGPG